MICCEKSVKNERVVNVYGGAYRHIVAKPMDDMVFKFGKNVLIEMSSIIM